MIERIEQHARKLNIGCKTPRLPHDRAMARTTTELLENILSLPDVDRSYLASKLLESLDGGEVSTEWSKEIERRVKSIDDGTAGLVPHDEVMEEFCG